MDRARVQEWTGIVAVRLECLRPIGTVGSNAGEQERESDNDV